MPTGLVDHCNGSHDDPHENGQVITRKEGIPEYLKWQVNYVAKQQGKGLSKDSLRDFGMSRINKPKNPQHGKEGD